MDNILLIDDDKNLGELLKEYFKQFSFQLDHALKPSEALLLLKKNNYQVIILDVMLPEMDGFKTFPKLREISNIPVIMLTARGELTDKVMGLEMGIDDYLAKPFEPRELIARIKALIRRSKNTQLGKKIRSDKLVLDLMTHRVTLDEVDLQLSTYEYSLLKIFMQKPHLVLSRDQLLDEMRGIEWESENRSIDVAISRLRQKLKDPPKNPQFIKTIWGDGYCFIANVEEVL